MIFPRQLFLLIALVIVFIAVAFWFVWRERAGVFGAQVNIKIGKAEVVAEVADTAWKKIKGLGGRESLAEGGGMFFVYGQPGIYAFWMKGMKFPIDIIWIGTDKTIADIAENVPPESFPKTFSPLRRAQYVLEVPAGFAAKNGWAAGDEVVFNF